MSDPYSKDGQIFTFGVHGTNNGPDNVREVTQRISAAVGETTNGANLWDNGFSWQDRSGTLNQTRDRQAASQELATHVLNQIDNAIERGTLDRDKPLTVNLVGFSHGGNVSILASDEISQGLRDRGINGAIHLTTLSTPAYTAGDENPLRARDQVHADGIQFAHTHFSTPGDGVIRGAIGHDNYRNGFTRDVNFREAPFGLNGVANHGAVQDVPEMMDAAAFEMRRRFNGLAPAQERSSVTNDTPVANLAPGNQNTPAPDWQAFNNNPMVQQASAALHRVAPDVPVENLNPSIVAGVAGVAAENRFNTIQDIAMSQNGQTAFVTDREKTDPAARVAPVDMAMANKPVGEVQQRYEVALNNSQQPPQIANLEQEQQQKRSTPSIG
jgi:hypothetical protein